MKPTPEQWKELALFLKDMVNHPMYKFYEEIQKDKIASLSIQGLSSDSDNRFQRGKIIGIIEQEKEFKTIINNQLEDTSDTSNKEN